MTVDWFRRCDSLRQTPAESAIRAALVAVEAAGGDVRLTDAVMYLVDAHESVANYVDGVNARVKDKYLPKPDEWRDRYNREVLGLNNEGDPIGGDPPRGLKHRCEWAETEVLRLRGLVAAQGTEARRVETSAAQAPSPRDDGAVARQSDAP
jgi:hypothetical protein